MWQSQGTIWCKTQTTYTYIIGQWDVWLSLVVCTYRVSGLFALGQGNDGKLHNIGLYILGDFNEVDFEYHNIRFCTQYVMADGDKSKFWLVLTN